MQKNINSIVQIVSMTCNKFFDTYHVFCKLQSIEFIDILKVLFDPNMIASTLHECILLI